MSNKKLNQTNKSLFNVYLQLQANLDKTIFSALENEPSKTLGTLEYLKGKAFGLSEAIKEIHKEMEIQNLS